MNSSPVKISCTNARTCGKVSAGPLRGRRRSVWRNAEGHRADDHVVLPVRIRAAFEMVEAEFGLENLDNAVRSPSAAAPAARVVQRGRRRQRDEVVLAAAGRPEPPLAEQPDFWGQPPPPVGGRGHAQGCEIGGPRRIDPVADPVAPLHPMPRPGSQGVAARADAAGVLGRPSSGAIARRRLGAVDAQSLARRWIDDQAFTEIPSVLDGRAACGVVEHTPHLLRGRKPSNGRS